MAHQKLAEEYVTLKMELLAPAGNMEKLKAAILFGADAVYLSGKAYGLRAFSDNFDLDEMQEAVTYAHAHGVRVYVTVNIYARNEDLQGLAAYLRNLDRLGVDAIIISDLGVLKILRETLPEMEVHVSTQANTTNWAAASFYQALGVKRVVLARELPWQEVQEIHEKNPGLELEVFVHGAMCMSYSGRCLLSNYMTGRDANQGACAQACRWNYVLMEEKRPGEYYPLLEDDRGSYIFNAKDMCLLEHLPLLHRAGVTSLKIEGRMKSAHYVATVTKAYRQALDAYEANPEQWQVQSLWLEEIGKVSNRSYTTGFFTGEQNLDASVNLIHTENQRPHQFVGVVLSYDPDQQRLHIEQRNRFCLGDSLEVVMPEGAPFEVEVTDLRDEKGAAIEAAPHPQSKVSMQLNRSVVPGSLLRRRSNG